MLFRLRWFVDTSTRWHGDLLAFRFISIGKTRYESNFWVCAAHIAHGECHRPLQANYQGESDQRILMGEDYGLPIDII